MKKLLVLGLVALVLLASGCTSQDPKQILDDAVNNMAKLSSYRASYDMTLSVYGMEILGQMDMLKKGEKTRVDTTMSMLGQEIVSSSYQLASGTYTCIISEGEVTCIKGEGEQGLLDPQKSLDMNSRMIERGVLSLTFNNIATVAGRQCYNLTSVFDVSKLSLLSEEDLSTLSIDPTQLGELESIMDFKITQCYDSETGFPLEMVMIMKIDASQSTGGMMGEVSMNMGIVLTLLEPNAQIADSEFDLPVTPTDMDVLAEVCVDPGTLTEMSYVQARSIALASDCMENATALKDTHQCNNATGTWWIDLDLVKEGCSPACVVSVADETAEINWRCTGVLPE